VLDGLPEELTTRVTRSTPRFDGVSARRADHDVQLVSHDGGQLGGSYPEVADALSGQDAGTFVVDGEVVAFERGRTSFARLQQRMQIDDPDRARASCV